MARTSVARVNTLYLAVRAKKDGAATIRGRGRVGRDDGCHRESLAAVKDFDQAGGSCIVGS